MKLGLFVEGPSDEDAIGTLARKRLSQSRVGLETRKLKNGVLSFDAIRSNAEGLFKLHRDVFKIIVCADAHSDPVIKGHIETTNQKLKDASLPVPVRYIKILHALEGWLLADLDALRASLGPNASLSRIPADLESRCDQEKILQRLFRRNKMQYDKARWAPVIASHADPAVIAARMSSFREFLDALKDP